MMPKVGFAGLTHLGLVSAVGLASKGFGIVGYDGDAAVVANIRAGRLPIVEPGLDDLAARHAAALSFTSAMGDLSACDIVYISTDVPTDDRGTSDLSRIHALIDDVTAVLGPQALLVVLCQVPPGFTRRIKLPAERLYYQVETLVFGRAVERTLSPERYIVGCADPTQPLATSYRAILEAFGCPILPMRYESAELAKISINCCLVASVTVANTLAELSEKIGADWNEIAPALRLDRRIGAYSYLAPGLGIAGGNLERDLATVLRFSEANGTEASLISAFLANSAHRRDWALRMLHQTVLCKNANPEISVLGLAYKENTHSTKNSPSFALIEQLKPWPIRVFDPVVPASAAPHPAASGATGTLDAVQGADVVLIMTPWPDFRKITPNDLSSVMKGRVVIDPYRIFEPKGMQAAGLLYFTLGAPAPQ
jgi:UDPglucose 6-dehydrogenase